LSEERNDPREGTTTNAAIAADSMPDSSPADNTENTSTRKDRPPKSRPPAPWNTSDFYQQQAFPGGRNREVHREDSMGNHWSVPWSDLMMVMFVLFAALVTAQTIEQKVPEYIDREKIKTIEKEKIVKDEILSPEPNFEPLMRINVFEKSQQAVRETNIENVEIVLMDDQSVKVSVQGPLFFDLGADTLKPDVKSFLNTLSGVIRQTRYKVNVIGHTDDKPINNDRFASNWELSLMRATRVAKHLITEGRIDPARFTIMGRSQYEPTTPNANDQFRALNRRVEIIITREVAQAVEDRL